MASSSIDRSPLPKAEVVKAVERKGPRRVPQVMTKWWGEGLGEQYGRRLEEFDVYPADAYLALVPSLRVDEMNLPWHDPTAKSTGHDSNVIISDWGQLDEFIARMPDPDKVNIFDRPAHPSLDVEHELSKGVIVGDYRKCFERAHREDRYLIFGWWNLFFEKPWSLRGMENTLTDYYLYPQEVHKLHDALCNLYVGYIRRAAREIRPDGFWASDDLGNQRQLMMSPAAFREFLLPYYRRVGAACRENGMHFWLHSCGNNTEILDDLIDAGLSVFHPVQKHTMDEVETARRFGGRLTFLAGIDVQHVLQEGTPEQVREEVRNIIDTFDRPDGGLVLAAGNGIVSGTPFENIRAYLDEGLVYGTTHRQKQ